MSSMRWGPPPSRGGGGGGVGSYHILGLFILRPVAWLMALVLAMSAGGALLERLNVPLLSKSVLWVGDVWHGEVWRLVTWAPIALDPLGLLFGLLLLYFISPDLLRRWGTRRFFVNYFAGAALVGALTCLFGAFVWRDVARVAHIGLWPMLDAMLIAWATLFQDRQILMFFALPVAGRNLVGLVIAISVVMGALNGFNRFVPDFLAELVALAYMNVIPVRSWTARARLAWFQQRYRRRTAKLMRVDRDEPPRWTH